MCTKAAQAKNNIVAQINLLKQTNSSPASFDQIITWGFRVCLLGFVLLLAYYGWLWNDNRSTSKRIMSLEQQVTVQKADIAKDKGRQEVLVRQLQLKELGKIIDTHLYWSQLIPELAKVTLKNASYVSIKGLSDGNLTLSVVVPTTEDLDKFLQVFDDTPKFNKYFVNLRIGPINRIQSGDGLSTKFDIRLNYDPSLLKYKPTDASKASSGGATK